MRRVGLVVVLVAALFPLALGGGCSSSSTNEPTSQTCTSGDTRSCTGPGSCTGGQTCGTNGTWSACDCGDASATCAGTQPLQCRACCDSKYSSQTAAFDQQVTACACKTDGPCAVQCSCEAGTGSPDIICLQCVSKSDAVGSCVATSCVKNGCGEFVLCIASCAG